MKKTLTAIVAAAALTASAASAQIVGIATGQQGSLGYNSGQALAKVAVTNDIVDARVQPMAGTAAYLPMVNQGDIDFGFCNAVEAEYAFTGTGTFDRANPNLRTVGVVFPLRTSIMAPADLGLDTVADLKAKAGTLKVAAEYSASTIIHEYIRGALANAGLTYDDVQAVPVSSFVAGIKALGDQQVDIALVSLNSGAGKEADAKLQGRGGLQYVSLDENPDAVAAFKKHLRAAELLPMDANPNIPGLKKPANIIAIPWTLVTNADVSDEVVYKLTKMIAEHNAELGEAMGAYKGWKLEKMAPESVVPYHPGALKYYEEAGVTVGN